MKIAGAVARRLRMWAASIGMAVRGLSANRMRASLSTLGIAIGVATLMAIYSLTQGLTQSFTNELGAMGANTLYLSARPWTMGDWWKYRNRPQVKMDDVRALEERRDIFAAIAPMSFSLAEVSRPGRAMSEVAVRGTNGDYLETTNFRLVNGRFLSALDVELGAKVAVIGADLRVKLFDRSDPIGSLITVGDTRLTVVGVLGPIGSMGGRSLDNIVVMPISTFQQHFGGRRGLIVGLTVHPQYRQTGEDHVIETIRRHRGLTGAEEDNFAVNRQSEILRVFNEQTSVLFGVAIAIGVITLIVGGVGVMNIMLVAVSERTREIGVRRALGATRKAVLVQFLLEAAFVTMVGGVLGTIAGLGGAWLVGQVTPLAADTSWQSAALGVVFSGVVGLVFGTWPAWRAAHLDPIESLRYE